MVMVFFFANIAFLPCVCWTISHRTLIPYHIITFFIILRGLIYNIQKITPWNFVNGCKSDAFCWKLMHIINQIIIKKKLLTKCITLLYDFYSFIFDCPFFLIWCFYNIWFINHRLHIWNIFSAYWIQFFMAYIKIFLFKSNFIFKYFDFNY